MKRWTFRLSPTGMLALFACWALSGAGVAQAEVIELRVNAATRASAEFVPGKDALPAVVLIHGFLQTRSSPVIAQLSEHLVGLGHTVLVPTLSLGIDMRRQSLDCEALHTHTMQQDIAEIRQWVEWLAKRGARRIVVIGHSTGALQALAYVSDHPRPEVIQTVLLSPVYFGARHAWLQANAAQLREQAARPNSGIEVYRFVYCDRYPAPPSALLSYVEWDRERSLAAVKQVAMPIYAVFGTVDPIVPADWAQALPAAGVTLERIEGGDHFFSGMAELELDDVVEQILAGAPAEPN